MAANPFDQFDANPFDEFDAKPWVDDFSPEQIDAAFAKGRGAGVEPVRVDPSKFGFGKPDPLAQPLDRTPTEMADAAMKRAPTEAKESSFDFDARARFKKSGAMERGLYKGATEFNKFLAGVAQFEAELLGADKIARRAADATAGMASRNEAIGTPAGDSRQAVLERNFEGAISSLTSQAPTMVASLGLATGARAFALGNIGVQSLMREFGEGRRQKLDFTDAVSRAVPFAAAEVAGEAFAIGPQIRALKAMFAGTDPSKLSSLIAKSIFADVPGEQLTTLSQFLTDKSPQFGLNKEAAFADYLDQVRDTLLQTMMQGGAMFAGGHVANQAAMGALGKIDQRQSVMAATDAQRAAEAKVGEMFAGVKKDATGAAQPVQKILPEPNLSLQGNRPVDSSFEVPPPPAAPAPPPGPEYAAPGPGLAAQIASTPLVPPAEPQTASKLEVNPDDVAGSIAAIAAAPITQVSSDRLMSPAAGVAEPDHTAAAGDLAALALRMQALDAQLKSTPKSETEILSSIREERASVQTELSGRVAQLADQYGEAGANAIRALASRVFHDGKNDITNGAQNGPVPGSTSAVPAGGAAPAIAGLGPNAQAGGAAPVPGPAVGGQPAAEARPAAGQPAAASAPGVAAVPAAAANPASGRNDAGTGSAGILGPDRSGPTNANAGPAGIAPAAAGLPASATGAEPVAGAGSAQGQADAGAVGGQDGGQQRPDQRVSGQPGGQGGAVAGPGAVPVQAAGDRESSPAVAAAGAQATTIPAGAAESTGEAPATAGGPPAPVFVVTHGKGFTTTIGSKAKKSHRTLMVDPSGGRYWGDTANPIPGHRVATYATADIAKANGKAVPQTQLAPKQATVPQLGMTVPQSGTEAAKQPATGVAQSATVAAESRTNQPATEAAKPGEKMAESSSPARDFDAEVEKREARARASAPREPSNKAYARDPKTGAWVSNGLTPFQNSEPDAKPSEPALKATRSKPVEKAKLSQLPPAIAAKLLAGPSWASRSSEISDIPGDLLTTFAGAIKAALDAGVPAHLFEQVSGFHTYRSGGDAIVVGNAEGKRSLGLRLSALEAARDNANGWGEWVAGGVAHEIGHVLAVDAKNPVGDDLAAQSPRFAMGPPIGKSFGRPTGDVMFEGYQLWVDGDADLSDFFSYPFNFLSSRQTNELRPGFFAEEFFAQSFSLYHINPSLMREKMPLGFALQERLHNELLGTIQSDGAGISRVVGAVLGRVQQAGAGVNAVGDAVAGRPAKDQASVGDEKAAGGVGQPGKSVRVKPTAVERGLAVEREATLEAGPPTKVDLARLAREGRANLAALEGLTQAERDNLTARSAHNFVRWFTKLPSVQNFAAIAWAGRAKRGWYKASAKALVAVFGVDAPRFAALLAATSPQTSVEANLENALRIWRAWVNAGRPQNRSQILRIMFENVIKKDASDPGVLSSWENNSVRALTHPDPGTLVISGPKVNSFFANLVGITSEVTNDAWMSAYARVDADLLRGTLTAGEKLYLDQPGKGPVYLAMSARARLAAKTLSKLTGDQWTPDEAQETIWSWAKALTEEAARRRAAGEEVTAEGIIRRQELDDKLIAAVTDFSSLLLEPKYATILEEAGYGDRLEDLGQHHRDYAQEKSDADARLASQAPPFTRADQLREEIAAARRIDRNRSDPLGALDKVVPGEFKTNTAMALRRPGWAIITATVGDANDPKNVAANNALRQRLIAAGVRFDELQGMYNKAPDGVSFLIYQQDKKTATTPLYTSEADAIKLGAELGQIDVLTNKGYIRVADKMLLPANQDAPYIGAAAKRQPGYSVMADGTAFSSNLPPFSDRNRIPLADYNLWKQEDHSKDARKVKLDAVTTPISAREDDGAWEVGRESVGDTKSDRAMVVESTDLKGDGRVFTPFFTAASEGKRAPNANVKYEPVIDISSLKDFSDAYTPHRGNFDDHIATSIPGFREVQQAVGDAIVKTYAQHSRQGSATLLDIAASEGAFNKAITSQSDGKIFTLALDPNLAMAKFFAEHSQVEGADYDVAAFGSKEEEGKLAWTEDDGTPIRFFKPIEKYDIVHEAMGFQFISNTRNAQFARVKELMEPNGVALFEEKIKDDTDAWRANEVKKDAYKAKYFTAKQIEEKAAEVLDKGAEASAAEDSKREQAVVGMNDLMTTSHELETALTNNWRHVVQYWDSGNFKGYVASDDPRAISRFLGNLVDLNSEFSTVQTPRAVNADDAMFGWDSSRAGAEAEKISEVNASITKTPAFKKWFGDSKVVDAKGKPLVVYHGTRADFYKFENVGGTVSSFLGSEKVDRSGFFFTDDPVIASEFAEQGVRPSGSNVMPVYLSVKNPLDLRGGYVPSPILSKFEEAGINSRWLSRFDWSNFDDQDGKLFVVAAQSLGYDGVLFREDNPNGGDSFPVYVAFRPEQIKSATGNRGTFDPKNEKITEAVGDRGPTFYSALERALGKAPYAKDGTIQSEQLRAWLASRVKDGTIRNDEVFWSGLEEYLKTQTGRVSKGDIAAFVTANGVQIKDVMLGEAAPPEGFDLIHQDGRWNLSGIGINIYSNNPQNAASEMRDRLERDARRWQQNGDDAKAGRYFDKAAEIDEWLEKISNGAGGESTKFASYQLPGGTNYRELLLTLPTNTGNPIRDELERKYGKYGSELYQSLTVDERAAYDSGRARVRNSLGGEFRSTHFDQPNIIAHIRFNERVDADGRRVLFVEEIQSDWAQKGRKAGFSDGNPPAGLTVKKTDDGRQFIGTWNDGGRAVGPYNTEQEVIQDAARKEGSGIPSAPFVGRTEAWVGLALKRMIRYGAENGFDRIAWTTGEQQADRYDLSKQISKVDWDADGFLYAYDLNGKAVIEKTATADELPDIIGKDAAEKLANAAPKKGVRSISGLDLKVGGEGMKAFYDRIVPQVANGILKRLGGGKVGEVDVRNEDLSSGAPPALSTYEVLDADGMVMHVTTTEVAAKRKAAKINGSYREVKPKRSEALVQPGFDITDTMRDRALEGQELFREARGDAHGFAPGMTPAQKAALEHVGVLPVKQPLTARLAATKKGLADRLVTGIVDSFHPLKALDPTGETWELAMLSKATSGGLEAIMRYGNISLVDKVQFSSPDGGKGFRQTLKDLDGEEMQFLAWVAANRAEMLMAEGREHLFTRAEIAEIQGMASGKMRDGRSRLDAYKQANEEMQAINRQVLDLAEDSGMIDPISRSTWEKDFYLPFYRVLEDDPTQTIAVGKGRGLVGQQAFQRLKGGTDKLASDLLGNIERNWTHILDASARNRAAESALLWAEATGAATQVGGAGKGVKFYMENGAKKFYIVHDQMTLTAITGLERIIDPAYLKWLTIPKQMITIGATADPTFVIRNGIRDTMSAIAQSGISANAFKNVGQGIAMAVSEKNKIHAAALAAGGIIHFGTMTDGQQGDYYSRLIREGTQPWTVLNSPAKVTRAAWNWWSDMRGYSEDMNRLSLIKQLGEKGASYRSQMVAGRDLLNFTQSGAYPVVQFLIKIVPFLNAGIQGLYRISHPSSKARFATVLLSLAAAEIALAALYADDDDWKKRKEFDRQNYFWFKVGDIAYRIPKPFEIGSIATLAGNTFSAATDDEMDSQRYWSGFRSLLANSLRLDPTPQLLRPILDVQSNVDFSGGHIETQAMEGLPKSERYGPRTSDTAKMLGQLAPAQEFVLGKGNALSPVQIDSLARGYFGWLGTMALTASDAAVNLAQDKPPSPDWQLRDVPTIGKFIETVPTNSSRYSDAFYDQATAIREAYTAYNAKVKAGDREGARDWKEAHGELIKLQPKVARYSEMLALDRAAIRRVEQSRDMDGAEKRERLDALYERMNRTVEKAAKATALQ